MEYLKTLSEKTTKLNQTQSFVLYIAILIFVMGIPIFSAVNSSNSIKANTLAYKEFSDKIGILTTSIDRKNINRVDYSAAQNIYNAVFTASMYELTRELMVSLSQNHIHDSVRKVELRYKYDRIVDRLYSNNIIFLSRLKYEESILSGALVNIDPETIKTRVFYIMFDHKLTQQNRRRYIEEYLNSNIKEFNKVAKSYLNL